MDNKSLVSIIVPIYNEAENIPYFYAFLSVILDSFQGRYLWEIIFVDDGSQDASLAELKKLKESDIVKIRILEFSRNFGKEAALSAGLSRARGDAAVMIDADFQHPMELIPTFLEKWAAGADVVIGIRKKNEKAGLLKRAGSFIFYRVIKRISRVNIMPNATDFRLVDRQVIDSFNRLSERNRMTRALIDWLGFRRDFIYFDAKERAGGHAGYCFSKLLSLAINSFVSLSLLPLKIAGYLGVFIVMTVGPFGFYVLLGKYLFDWAFPSSFTGPAQLAILITFLVGVILSSLGLVALYIAHIHDEVVGRPLYIIRKNKYE